MIQFYFKEKFDVLRMFRLLVSSRYRRVRKIQLHLVLFALFIYTTFKEDNIHQSFVSMSPTYGDNRRIAGVRCWTIPAVPGKCEGYYIGTLTLLGFSVV